MKQSKFTEAEIIFKNCIDMQEKKLGALHPSLATSFEELSQLYHALGRLNDAEKYAQKAFEIRQVISIVQKAFCFFFFPNDLLFMPIFSHYLTKIRRDLDQSM